MTLNKLIGDFLAVPNHLIKPTFSIRGKWEACIENDSIPAFLIEKDLNEKFEQRQSFLIDQNEFGGYRVIPVEEVLKSKSSYSFVKMDEHGTIPAPYGLLETLKRNASNEIIMVGMMAYFEIYARSVWNEVERDELLI